MTASISANVLHTYLEVKDDRGIEQWGPLASSGFWPVALYICLEVMARVSWPPGWVYITVRFAGLGLVAGIAAFVSYVHMNGLLEHFGEWEVVRYVGPAAVDGLMLLCSAALVAIGQNVRAAQVAVHDAPTPHQELPEAPEAPEPTIETPKDVKRRGKAEEYQKAAHELYLKSVADGKPMTGDELGEALGKSGRWGRSRTAEAKQMLEPSMNGTEPS